MNEIDVFILNQIEHAGVKGMKWGVRRERRVQALERGGTKGGPISSRVRAATNIGPVDFIRGRGIRGGAARKAVRVRGQLERFDTGKASALDVVKRYGSTRVTDLVPVRESKAEMRTTAKRDVAVVAALGTVVALRILAAQAQKRVA